MSSVIAKQMNRAALRLNTLVREHLGTMPLMATFYAETTSAHASWSELVDAFASMRDTLGTPQSCDEQLLSGMLTSFELQARVGQGEPVSWVDQVRGFVQIDPKPIAEDRLIKLREHLEAALDQADYSGPLAEATRAWNTAQRVPKASFDAAAHAYLAESKRLAETRLGGLPSGTNIELKVVHGVFYNGYNEYFGRFQGECRLNGDFEWTYPQLRHTIAHEAFPGHHAISAIREELAASGQLPQAGALYYARTPLTPVIEGVCEVGSELLSWDWSVHDEVYSRFNRYRKAVMTNVAIAINRDGLSRNEAITMLKLEALADQEWAEARYTFLTHPLWNTSFPHYWFGTEQVREALDRLKAAGLANQLIDLTHRYPHSVETFQKTVDTLLAEHASSPGAP